MYCYPKGGGRRLLTSGLSNEWRYDDDNDVLVTVDACWWRTKGGSPKDCKAFWRGTPAPTPVEEAASPVEEATPRPDPDEGEPVPTLDGCHGRSSGRNTGGHSSRAVRPDHIHVSLFPTT